MMSAKRELFHQELPPSVVGPTPGTVSSVRDKELTEDSDYVGFGILPCQIYRKAVRRGFDISLMVVGESGLGKTTFINNLFLSDIYSEQYPGPSERVKPTIEIDTTKVVLEENGVKLNLTIIDVPGFGDKLDNTGCWRPIIQFIDKRFDEYLEGESRIERTVIPDDRVHCCLYFISPNGYGLKSLDIEAMKQLQDKVNVVPVIAKADSFTSEECMQFKRIIMNQIAHHNIKIYDFPSYVQFEESEIQKTIKERLPFAIMGSVSVVDANGKRGRKYPWGTAEVANIEHCDFIALRNLLLRTHMQNLKDSTNYQHYELYRGKKLAGLGSRVCYKNSMAQMEEEKLNFDAKLKRMEQHIEQMFEIKMKEKLQKLKDSEAELERRNEQILAAFECEKKELKERRLAFENEKSKSNEDGQKEMTPSNSDKKREKRK